MMMNSKTIFVLIFSLISSAVADSSRNENNRVNQTLDRLTGDITSRLNAGENLRTLDCSFIDGPVTFFTKRIAHKINLANATFVDEQLKLADSADRIKRDFKCVINSIESQIVNGSLFFELSKERVFVKESELSFNLTEDVKKVDCKITATNQSEHTDMIKEAEILLAKFMNESGKSLQKTRYYEIDMELVDGPLITNDFILLSNKHLQFKKLEDSLKLDELDYYCQKISSNITHKFIINVEPHVKVYDVNETKISSGSFKEISCITLSGNYSDATWTWFKDGLNITGKYNVTQIKHRSVLKIAKASQEDNGLFRCMLTNMHGSHNVTIKVSINSTVQTLWPMILSAGVTVVAILVVLFIEKKSARSKSNNNDN